MEKSLLKTTVRETVKQDKLAQKVMKELSKLNHRKVSKAEAYRLAMADLAFSLGIS